MNTRDQYVAKLKARLDQWNAQAARWESQAQVTKEQQLEALKLRRDQALYQLKLIEGASASAWQELAKGADAAWDQLHDAAGKARAYFEKSTAKSS